MKDNDTAQRDGSTCAGLSAPDPLLSLPGEIDGNVDDRDFELSAERHPPTFAFIEAKVSSAHVPWEAHGFRCMGQRIDDGDLAGTNPDQASSHWRETQEPFLNGPGLSIDDARGIGCEMDPRYLRRADQEWKHGLIERPAMLAASKGGWWLFYS